MTKTLPWTGRFALFLFLPAGILPFVYPGQQHSAFNRELPNDPGGVARPVEPKRLSLAERSPAISDWSTRHVLYTQFGTSRSLELLQREPRARFRWQEVARRGQPSRFNNSVPLRSSVALGGLRNFPGHPPVRQSATGIQADWNITLGNGAAGPSQFPAKYSFNVNATPDCVNDFAVFPINTTPTTTQPNLIGFYMLYSGTGPTGICNSRPTIGTIPALSGGSDTVSSPVVDFNYSVRAISGAVATSPTLSLDGTKIAFVESTNSAAHFHVLAWKTGDGWSTSSGLLGTSQNRQTINKPASITSFIGTAPAAGSGTASDLTLGSASDKNSSPYIDYSNDFAYVANDKGVLFRIQNVFCTLPACGNAAPSLDPSFGTGGVVTVCAGSVATGPTEDFLTGNVYVGCSDGKLYGYTTSGTPLPNSPVAIGDGSSFGDVADPPIVDPSNQFVYAFSGTGAGGNTSSAVLVQLHTDLSTPRIALVGSGGYQSTHAPAFNDPYFTSTNSANWLIYFGGYDAAKTNLTFYGVTFDASRNLTTGAATNVNTNIGTRLGEYTPLTEFVNGGQDYIFFGLLIGIPNWARQTITTFTTAAPTQPPGGSLPNSSTGVTPMIVDNNSTSAQASSIYFTSIGTNAAYKYTQVGLN
jgi:hypothetical protein